MAEYIKREDAQNMLDNAQIITDAEGEFFGYCTEDVNINAIPAADVRENVHSEWVSVCGLYHCKNCGCIAPYDVEADVIMYWPELNYCPRCGADMRGVK